MNTNFVGFLDNIGPSPVKDIAIIDDVAYTGGNLFSTFEVWISNTSEKYPTSKNLMKDINIHVIIPYASNYAKGTILSLKSEWSPYKDLINNIFIYSIYEIPTIFYEPEERELSPVYLDYKISGTSFPEVYEKYLEKPINKSGQEGYKMLFNKINRTNFN